MSKSYDTWWLDELYIEAARGLMQELVQLRRNQMSKETKIDWTKPIELNRYGRNEGISQNDRQSIKRWFGENNGNR
jgi:hypothetical protein